jgi:hypothetical protein
MYKESHQQAIWSFIFKRLYIHIKAMCSFFFFEKQGPVFHLRKNSIAMRNKMKRA